MFFWGYFFDDSSRIQGQVRVCDSVCGCFGCVCLLESKSVRSVWECVGEREGEREGGRVGEGERERERESEREL